MKRMKRIVFESLYEYQKANINEFDLKKTWDRTKSSISKISDNILSGFKKIGDFFIGIVNGEPVSEVMLPINIGVMVNKNILDPKIVSYLPSPEDQSLDPNLKMISPKELTNKRTYLGSGSEGQKDEGIADLLASLAAESGMNESIKSKRPKRPKRSKRKIFEGTVPLKHPNTNFVNVDTKELQEEIEMAIEMGEESKLLIWGGPGIGKTQIVNSVLKSKPGTRLIDVVTSQMAPEDWQMPAVKQVKRNLSKVKEAGEDDEWYQAIDVPKSWLPVYKPTGDLNEDAIRNNMANMGDENTEGKGGIIFFDELSRATPKVQNSCLKIIDERKIGEYILGDKWVIIAAANRNIDDPESQITFGNALANRMSHVNFEPDFESWAEWAFGKVDQRILDYLEFTRDDFYTLNDEDTMGEANIFASPRSWVKASKNLAIAMQVASKKGVKRLSARRLKLALSKDLGVDVAERVIAFIKLLENFRPEDIKKIFTDPTKVKTPKKAGSGFSLSDVHALLSAAIIFSKNTELTPLEFENFATYLTMLDNSSVASSAMIKIFKYHPYMHEELGERDGHDKFVKGFKIFEDKYGKAF